MPPFVERPSFGGASRGLPALSRRALSLRPVRFVLVGGLNTLFGYGLFVIFFLIGHHRQISLVLATAIGAIFNFFTVGRLVFASRGIRMLPPFLVGYAVALGANMALLEGLARIGLPTLLAQGIAMPMVVVVSYLTNRYGVFRETFR